MSESVAPREPSPPTAKAALLLVLAGLFAYFNSLHGAFIFDDFRFVSDPNIGKPLDSTLVVRPVVAITISANFWLDGYNTRGYHLLNLAVHVLAAVVLFDLVRRTLLLPRFGDRFASSAGWVSLAVAAVWLVHPLNTQAVTYVVQRCESMMGMFLLVAFWCFLRGVRAERRAARWYAGGWAAALAGVGCKEMMVALPPLLLLYDRTFLTGSWRETLRKRWRVHLWLAIPPLIGVAVVFRSGIVSGAEPTVGAGVALYTPYTYALTQTEVILHYLRLALWPTGFALDCLDWPARQSLREARPTALGLGGLLALTAYGVVRNRAWAFAAAWFFVNLAPTSSFVPIQDAAFEHRMYLPLIGVVVLFVMGVVVLARRSGRGAAPRVAAGVLAGVVVVLGFLTVVRNEDYSSAIRIYADNVAKRPNNARSRGAYADLLRHSGKPAEAEAEMRTALSLPRIMPGDRNTFTMILNEAGKADDALHTIRYYYSQEPLNTDFRRQLGLLLVVAGQSGEAVPHLRAIADHDPADKVSRLHLAVALAESGKQTEAAAERKELMRRNPEYPREVRTTARRTAVDPGANPQALRMAALFAEAVQQMADPGDADALDTLAICLARIGRYEQAAETAARAAAGKIPDVYNQSLILLRLELFRAKKPYLPESFTADGPKGGKP